MFAIEELLKDEKLSALRKVYERDENDRRLVVVVKDGEALVEETVSLHQELQGIGYCVIPEIYESEDLDEYDVVHISKMSLQTQRRR